MSETQREASSGSGAQDAASARAEELVDRAGQRVGEFAVSLERRLRVFAARAREEAEDIWAEAQSMRHTGEQP